MSNICTLNFVKLRLLFENIPDTNPRTTHLERAVFVSTCVNVAHRSTDYDFTPLPWHSLKTVSSRRKAFLRSKITRLGGRNGTKMC